MHFGLPDLYMIMADESIFHSEPSDMFEMIRNK